MRNIEAFGAGCAFLDYDGDGFQDILLTGNPRPALYHNEEGKGFRDTTVETGLDKITGDWKGMAVGDYDGDGRMDLLLVGYRSLALLHNRDGSHFENATVAAGLDPHNKKHWGSSAGFMDLTGTGKLDLIILNYVVFGPKEQQYCELRPGIKSGCPPHVYKPEFGELWENLGGGKFREITATSGMKDTHGKALVVAFADVDDCGRMDFYIGNDGTPAELMRNQGNHRFKNTGVVSGVAYGDISGHAIAAMGADWADFNGDSRLDLAISAFSDEAYSLLKWTGKGLFQHAAAEMKISGPTYKPLGFGTKWADVDNDGWPDLLFCNGHVYDNADQIDPLSSYRQPMMIFHNVDGKQMEDLIPQLGPEVGKSIVGRGMATGDFDNDGRMDVVVVDYEGPPLFLHNLSDGKNHWITLDMRGKSPNTFGYGARVTAIAGGRTLVGQVSPSSSYLSSSDPRIHFGLGSATQLDSLKITWADGRKEILLNLPADRIHRIQEGSVGNH